MIRAQNISKFYGSGAQRWPVLNNLSFTVPKSQIFGIIGPSGAGKSTLLRTFNQLERFDSGSLWIDDLPIHQLSPKEHPRIRQRIGMIFQQFNLLKSRTVYENILLPLEIQGIDIASVQSHLEQVLALTELEQHRHKRPDQLSGGQQQRVAIARSLASKPSLLLCDEATSALDPSTSHNILQLLKKLHQELSFTIVLVTHDLHVIASICEQVLLLEQGQCIEQNQVYRFFSAPQSKTAQQWVHHYFGVEPPNTLQYTSEPTSQLLLRLSYTDSPAQQPIISQLVKEVAVEVNILRGNIEKLQAHTIGILLVTISGTHEARQQGIAFLKERQVQVEVLSYVV